MRRLLIIPLLICAALYGQDPTANDTEEVSRGIAGSKDRAQINETILKGNALVDSIAVHLDSIEAHNDRINTNKTAITALGGSGDTAVIFAPFIERGDTSTIFAPFIERGDTATIFTPFIERGDTAAMLAPYPTTVEVAAGYQPLESSFTDITVTGTATIATLDYDPPHGAMSFGDSSTVVALTDDVWDKLTGPAVPVFVVQDQDDITLAGDTITITVDGDYMATLSISFSGTSSDIFEIAFYKNSVKESVSMSRSTSNNDVGNMTLPVYLENLVAGDDISIWIRNTGDNDDATLISGSLTIYMLHPD